MLTQRKENERFRMIDEVLSDNKESIGKILQRMELLEIYQHQGLQSCEQMGRKISKVDEFENRIIRVEERCKISSCSENRSTP